METRFLRSESPPEGRAKYWNNIPPTTHHELGQDKEIALSLVSWRVIKWMESCGHKVRDRCKKWQRADEPESGQGAHEIEILPPSNEGCRIDDGSIVLTDKSGEGHWLKTKPFKFSSGPLWLHELERGWSAIEGRQMGILGPYELL